MGVTMKSFIISIITCTLVAFAGYIGLYPTLAHANARDSVCDGIQLTGGSCEPTPDQPNISGTIQLVVNILSVVVGITAVIMIIIGGFKYITSTGDSASVNSAKNTILYAIIGLVIVALAQVIVAFVLNRVQQTATSQQVQQGVQQGVQ